MQMLPFCVHHADHQMYEPKDAFMRHLPKRYKRDFNLVEKGGCKKLVMGGVPSEFIPNPTGTSIGNGGTRISPSLARFDGAGGQIPNAFKLNPRNQFQKHEWVAPFYEDDVNTLKCDAPAESLLFGSDCPRPEGVAEPLQYLEAFAEYRPDRVEKVFSSNLKGLLAGAAL